MILGGLIRIDLLECDAHPSTPAANHVRITPFTNHPIHITNPDRATEILNTDPREFWARKSSVEVSTLEPMGPHLRSALELEIKSQRDSARNALEIVFAGVGFVA